RLGRGDAGAVRRHRARRRCRHVVPYQARDAERRRLGGDGRRARQQRRHLPGGGQGGGRAIRLCRWQRRRQRRGGERAELSRRRHVELLYRDGIAAGSAIFLAGARDRRADPVGERDGESATTGANDCVLALNPTTSSAVLLNGTVSINLSCGLAVNSSSSQALLMNGTNSITATSVDVVGNVLRNPSAGNPITPAATTGAASTPDPYAGLAVPSLPGGGCASPTSYNGANQTWNLSAGVKYCSNLTFNGANDTVNFAPGTYYFDRASLVVNGSGITLNGTGVTFVFTTSTGSGVGGLTMNGQVTAHLSAPTAGSGQPLPGFVFYQDRRASAGGSNTFNGNPSSQVTGALYFPSQG